jgi:hypothetical protein
MDPHPQPQPVDSHQMQHPQRHRLNLLQDYPFENLTLVKLLVKALLAKTSLSNNSEKQYTLWALYPAMRKRADAFSTGSTRQEAASFLAATHAMSLRAFFAKQSPSWA